MEEKGSKRNTRTEYSDSNEVQEQSQTSFDKSDISGNEKNKSDLSANNKSDIAPPLEKSKDIAVEVAQVAETQKEIENLKTDSSLFKDKMEDQYSELQKELKQLTSK